MRSRNIWEHYTGAGPNQSGEAVCNGGWSRQYETLKPTSAAPGFSSPSVEQLRLLVSVTDVDAGSIGLNYGRQLATLLHAETSLHAHAGSDTLLPADHTDHDLVILDEPDQSRITRWLTGWAKGLFVHRAADKLAASLLVARRPRWPLREILTILRGEASDETAINWTLRLTAAAPAHVTLLPIIPSQPGFYNHGGRIQVPLEVLLAANSTTGRTLRRQLQRLIKSGTAGRMTTYLGAPAEQIESAVAATDPDLIVIAAETSGYLWRWWLGELVRPLLFSSDRPVLVAKSVLAE